MEKRGRVKRGKAVGVIGKPELVSALSKRAGLTKSKGVEILDVIISEVVYSVVNGGTVKLLGFGKFYCHKAPARNGHNPKTGASVKIKARKSLKFKAASQLKIL